MALLPKLTKGCRFNTCRSPVLVRTHIIIVYIAINLPQRSFMLRLQFTNLPLGSAVGSLELMPIIANTVSSPKPPIFLHVTSRLSLIWMRLELIHACTHTSPTCIMFV